MRRFCPTLGCCARDKILLELLGDGAMRTVIAGNFLVIAASIKYVSLIILWRQERFTLI
jgi:hypothetical protein